MAGGRKRRPKAGPGDGVELRPRRAEPGEPTVLAGEGGPEEARVVGPEGDRHPGAQEREDGVPRRRKGPRRRVRRQADVERDAGAGEPPDERRVGGGGDAVGDPPRLEPPERLGDGVGTSDLPGVNDGGEAEAGEPPVDRGEVARGERELVSAEAEADDARPGVARVEVEDAVRGVGAEVPDGVEEDADASAPAPLVRREDRLDGVADGGPRKPEPVDDGGGDVDLGVRDALPAEAGRQVACKEGEVGRVPKQPADVAVEGEEARKAVERPAGPHRGDVGEERRAGPPGEADERRRADGSLEVKVQLGQRTEAGREGGDGHAGGSYGRTGPADVSLVPSERLWLRAAAFGLDLICLAGGPLLLATIVVFLVVLFSAEPPAGLPRVYRAAQLLFVALFLLRDARGASPGKSLLGLSVVRRGGGRAGVRASVLRNLPLLVPGLNLLEAAAVARRPDSRRLGDRLAGTTVGES